MSRVLELAKDIKFESRSLYEHFKAEQNESYMAHMRTIFDSAERIRYAIEEEHDGIVPPDAWMAILAIMHMGCRNEDYSDTNESLVLPLYKKFALMETVYKQAHGTPNNSFQRTASGGR